MHAGRSVEPAARHARAIVQFWDAPADKSKSFTLRGGFAQAAEAALCHGTAAHALDFDDTNHPAYAHPSASMVLAMLAVAPMVNATGEDLITAYIVGFDLMGSSEGR